MFCFVLVQTNTRIKHDQCFARLCVVAGVSAGFRGVTEMGSTLHCKAKPVSPQEALPWKVILKCIIMGNLLKPNH